MLVRELDPVIDVANALASVADLPGVVLFDSVRVSEELGRWSFLSADPFLWFEIPSDADPLSPFAELRAALRRFEVERSPGLPPFIGGCAGILSYELGRCFERLPKPSENAFEFPLLAVGMYDWVLAWDHASRRSWLISHGFPEEGSARTRRAVDRADEIEHRLHIRATTPLHVAPKPIAHSGTHALPHLPGVFGNFTRDEYMEAVQRVIEYIAAGDIFQANLSQRLLIPATASPIELYRRLRACNPAPFAGCFLHDDWAVLSASPERFLKLDGRNVETRPIKGTRRRRNQADLDLLTRDELRESPKDLAENVMIVDLLRNDLSRVCSPRSIRVPRLCEVEVYETVQHLVSVVCGELSEGNDFWDLLAATFPGGSITGAPKIRAMEIICELEQTARGPYCGNLFYLGYDGQADSSILIRTFLMRHGWLECGVGGGIVIDSNPSDEYAETLDKAAGMLRAVNSEASH
jgi:para-aminobenzoate synthetase component 1